MMGGDGVQRRRCSPGLYIGTETRDEHEGRPEDEFGRRRDEIVDGTGVSMEAGDVASREGARVPWRGALVPAKAVHGRRSVMCGTWR